MSNTACRNSGKVVRDLAELLFGKSIETGDETIQLRAQLRAPGRLSHSIAIRPESDVAREVIKVRGGANQLRCPRDNRTEAGFYLLREGKEVGRQRPGAMPNFSANRAFREWRSRIPIPKINQSAQ
jgi:hypothetical protein